MNSLSQNAKSEQKKKSREKLLHHRSPLPGHFTNNTTTTNCIQNQPTNSFNELFWRNKNHWR